MSASRCVRAAAGRLAVAVAVAAAAYGAYVGRTWLRYGRVDARAPEERDQLLDQFMPAYEVAERHHVHVNAPAPVALSVAREMDLQESLVVRAVIRARELILGASRESRAQPRGLLADMQALGWGVLADVPGQEVVVGAVTRPWEANVAFRAVPPDRFAEFAEPDYVKIVWTLRADAISQSESILRTETRVIATDAQARGKFRTYWAFLSPGIRLIRWAAFRPARHEAERRTANNPPTPPAPREL